jgi:hypothetical protein
VPGAADGEPIAIHADHINMVKFGSKTEPEYKTVSGHLRLMAVRAGDVIGQQWDTECRVDAGMQNGLPVALAEVAVAILTTWPQSVPAFLSSLACLRCRAWSVPSVGKSSPLDSTSTSRRRD